MGNISRLFCLFHIVEVVIGYVHDISILYIHTYTLFNLEFRVAKDKLVSSSYKYDSKYC